MRLKMVKVTLVFWLSCLLCLVSTKAQRSPYKAAVMEYSPTGSVFSQTPAEVLGANLDGYGQLIAQAAKEEAADIVVFPEYGLTTLTLSSLSRTRARPFLQQFPAINSTSTAVLCDNQQGIKDDQLVFTRLSCYARQNGIYVAANVGEVVLCQPGTSTAGDGICPDDGGYQYSTNVVFDRQGRLVARYRKTHLFLEPCFQEPLVTDHSTFMTDFGVQFGLLTCFDIMFYEPALTLYYMQGIRDFVFPTAWVDELPYLTAAQIQEGWSRFLGIHLLASGYHLPGNGMLGSGVFGPLGPINYTFSPDSGSRMITGLVPSSQTGVGDAPTLPLYQDRWMDRWMEPHGMLYENLTGYSSLLLENGQDQSVTLCHDELCCNLNYTSSCPSGDCAPYRLLAYSGFRTLGGGMYTVAIQLCGLVACGDAESVQSCARQSVGNRTVNFLQDSFHLEGNFSSAKEVYPTATTSTNLQLLPTGSLQLVTGFLQNGVTQVGLVGNGPEGVILSDILAVGLYGRAYGLDPIRSIK